ncbi:hypothetical protein Tco_1441559 [Tanacetum coccineum]
MKVPQGKKPGARSGLRRKQPSKHTSESKTEASKSKTSQLDKETRSSSTKDKSTSHPLASTPVVGEMYKEAQQAVGGPTSLGATSEEGDHPQLSSGCDASADSTSEADPGISAPNDFIPEQQDKTKSAKDGLKTVHTDLGTNEESIFDEISKKIKLEDLSNLMQDTRFAFLTLDSPRDEPIIISDESKEEETKRYEDTYTTSHDGPEDTSNPHPPSPKSFLGLPSQISSVQEKLKTLDALPSLLHKVTDTLNRFATIVENASTKAIDKGVPSAGHASASPTEGEKNTNKATKDADNANLNQQPTTTTPPTTSSFQSPIFPKIKGKEVMSSKDVE